MTSVGSIRDRIRRRGVTGVAFALSQRGWAAWTRVYLGPQLAALGRGTVIRAPRLIAGASAISIGSDGFIREDVRLEVVDRPGYDPSTLVIGDRVNIEQNVHITSAQRTAIGNDVCLAANVVIAGASHPAGRAGDGNRALHVAGGASSIEIGDRVFIGANAVVLADVRIGANAIIGAGAVVTSDVPADAIAAGVPARVVRTIGE